MSSLQTTYAGRIDDDFPAVTRFVSFLAGSVPVVSSAETCGSACWHQSLSLPALRVQNAGSGPPWHRVCECTRGDYMYVVLMLPLRETA